MYADDAPLDDELLEQLRSLDHPRPRMSAAAIATRARVVDRSQRIRWVAVLAAIVGATGAAWAFPGSPLPGWIRSLAGRVTQEGSAPPPVVPDSVTREAVVAGGIAVAPGTAILIEILDADGGELRVQLTDGEAVEIRAVGDAPGFTSDPGRITIRGRGVALSLDVRIPRFARRVEIRAGSKRVFLKEGDRLEPGAGIGPVVVVPLTG